MKGFNPIASLTAAVKTIADKLEQVFVKFEQVFVILAEHSAILEQVLKNQEVMKGQLNLLVAEQKITREQLNFLVAELSRFKTDSDSLLISIFAYCHITGYRADRDEMKHMGRKAKRMSIKFDYKYATTQDPRFGEVHLFDPELLRDLFPVQDVND